MFPCHAGSCLRAAVFSVLWFAPDASLFAAQSDRSVINPLVTLGKLAVALTVVLLVFWLFAKVMRQFQGFHNGAPDGLRIVSALSVGQRERIVVVQVGDEQLVLGVTSSQINPLHVMDRPLSNAASGLNSSDFKNKLSAALKPQVSRT